MALGNAQWPRAKGLTTGNSKTGFQTGTEWFALAGIVILGGWLRFYRIQWGLEEGRPFPDETLVWPRFLVGFIRRGFAETWATNITVYPSIGPFVAGIGNWVASVSGYESDLRAGDLVKAIGIGRVSLAIVGLLAIPATYAIGRISSSPRRSLMAAALVATTPIVVIQSKLLSVDTVLITASAAALYATLLLDRKPTVLRSAFAGATIGACFAVKYNALILGIIPSLVLLNLARTLTLRGVAAHACAFGLSMLLVAGLGCPTCVMRPDLVLEQFRIYAAIAAPSSELPLASGATLPGIPHPVGLLGLQLPHALGPIFALAVAVGGVRAALRHRSEDLIILGFALVPLIQFLSTPLFFLRYTIVAVPAFALLACNWASPTSDKRNLVRAGFFLLFAATLGQSLIWEHRFQVRTIQELIQEATETDSQTLGVLASAPNRNIAIRGRHYGYFPALERAGVDARVVWFDDGTESHHEASDAERRAQEARFPHVKALPLSRTCDSELDRLILSSRTLRALARRSKLETGASPSELVRRISPCWESAELRCERCELENIGPWTWTYSAPSYGSEPFYIFSRQSSLDH